MTPFVLKPVAKDYLWGGTRLKTEFNKQTELEIVAETWECSVHPDGMSIISEGDYAGKTLKDVLDMHPEYLGCKYSSKKELPIMIKFIDAAKDLSVQVHPNDDYARKYENQNGKTEMWYILDAKEGAKLIYGFNEGVSKDVFTNAVKDGRIMECLNQVSIKKGETYLIPAGTVHAIGAGTLIAEIQENSNVTYRLYDYDRVDKNGNKRELHLEKAMDVMSFEKPNNNNEGKVIKETESYILNELCSCEYFTVKKINISKNCDLFINEDSFQVLLCVEGNAKLKCNDDILDFTKGQCVFLPAGVGNCSVEGTTEILNVVC